MRQRGTVLGLALALASLQPRVWSEEIKPDEASSGGPTHPSSHITIATDAEPGERLIISGTIFGGDGRTPMAGARLYLYHTDAGGVYSSRGPRHPRLRGWLGTGPDGRYEFRTIRPGHYPGRRVPAHIHATLRAPRHTERWIDDYWFEGDPYLGPGERARASGNASFSPILRLERGPDGVFRGTRDLRIDTYRSSGTGGQHVKVTDSAVRIMRLPTGIVVACPNERSQIRNREVGMKILKARIYDLELQKKKEKLDAVEAAKKEISFRSQIRSYATKQR